MFLILIIGSLCIHSCIALLISFDFTVIKSVFALQQTSQFMQVK